MAHAFRDDGDEVVIQILDFIEVDDIGAYAADPFAIEKSEREIESSVIGERALKRLIYDRWVIDEMRDSRLLDERTNVIIRETANLFKARSDE
jgi:hypothetical protein